MLKIENINDAVLIPQDELNKIVKKLNVTDENEVRLRYLDEAKQPYLFNSDDLAKIVDTTTSVRTKISMIGSIGPRLTDPKGRMDYFLSLFRFAEEKSQVEEILKARAQTLNSSIFNRGAAESIRTVSGRGAGGRGPAAAGRGRGRGAGVSSVASESRDDLSQEKLSKDSDKIISGADGVFAELDELVKKSQLSASSDDYDARTPIKGLGDNSPSQPNTDTEQSSVSSDEHDKVFERRSSAFDLNSGLTPSRPNSLKFGSPPLKLSAAANPLQQLKKTQQEKPKDPPTNPFAKSAVSVYAPSSNTNTTTSSTAGLNKVSRLAIGGSWIKADSAPSKIEILKIPEFNGVQSGTVQSKLSAFSHSPQTTPTSVPTKPNFAVTPTSTPPIARHSYNGLLTRSASAKFAVPSSTTNSPAPVLASGASSSGSCSVSNNDLAGKCAAALKITRDEFLALPAESCVCVSDGGLELFTYKELVRKNFNKEYTGVSQSELEKHLAPSEFKQVFDKDESAFFAQARWKQLDQKKKAFLF